VVSSRASAGYSLTARELEVLDLIAFGLTNKDIAQRLTLSPRTIDTHVERLLSKLNATTRTGAVAEAGRAGLLSSGSTQTGSASFDTRPNNLPFQLTTLLGREQELEDVKSLLDAHRLVTLSGSGGVGKTRLALRVGVDLLDFYPGGIWFCDFSPIENPELVASVIAKVLGVRGHFSRPLTDSIVQALRRKRALLILDNCEHVLDAAAVLTDALLHDCSGVHILATSRQPLGIIGEVAHRTRSLALPHAGVELDAHDAVDYGAIALFVNRARALDTGFALSDDNAPVVADICRRLDGIPLAIELAVARLASVNLSSLALSLDDRLKFLTAGSRTAWPRQKTLTALIDWSYDLLTLQEQTLFDRLGIFAGGFSLKAVKVVCTSDGINEADILALLSSLVDKSLLVAEAGRNLERYRLLESTRAYALEQLEAAGQREPLARRYSQYFCEEARTADECYGMGSTIAWAAGVELDLDNYRAVLQWAL